MTHSPQHSSMATTSFAFSNQLNRRSFSAISAPHSPRLRSSIRVSAGYPTAEVGTAKTESFYDVLRIQTGATCQEIKSAYRKLARVLHPDVTSKYSDEDASSAEEFMRVQAAYATLSDPEKRAMYDDSLFRRRRRPAVTSDTGYSELTRWGRSWETDQCW